MSGWLEALLGKILNSNVSIPLSKGINFATGLVATLNQTTKLVDVSVSGVTASMLPTVGIGQQMGRRIDDPAGPPVNLTGKEQGENIRHATFQNGGSGTNLDIVLLPDTTVLFFTSSGSSIRSISQAVIDEGRELRVELLAVSGVLTLLDRLVVSVPQYQLAMPNKADMTIGDVGFVTLRAEGAQWRMVGWSAGVFRSNHDGLVPASGGGAVNFLRADQGWTTVGQASLSVVDGNGEGVSFRKRVAFTASGATGTLIDVVIWNASAPFALRFDATLRVSVAAGTAAALRTATAGGGSVILPDAATPTQTFSTAAVGCKFDNAGATATVAANGTVILRVDRAVTGEIILDCVKT